MYAYCPFITPQTCGIKGDDMNLNATPEKQTLSLVGENSMIIKEGHPSKRSYDSCYW